MFYDFNIFIYQHCLLLNSHTFSSRPKASGCFSEVNILVLKLEDYNMNDVIEKMVTFELIFQFQKQVEFWLD